MIGFMGNMLPARAGEVILAYLLAKREDITFPASFASIVMERIFDTFMLDLACVAFITGTYSVLFDFSENFHPVHTQI